jgi:hypothetical protein
MADLIQASSFTSLPLLTARTAAWTRATVPLLEVMARMEDGGCKERSLYCGLMNFLVDIETISNLPGQALARNASGPSDHYGADMSTQVRWDRGGDFRVLLSLLSSNA